uniref:DNA-directed RNA polymerase II subunit RPB1 n=1 Tax=viral metagenome TaxID=1070528 RepID=A0A6C0IIL0_9ZZZZ
MSNKAQPTSDIEPIVGIQFGIFSPDEIERRSVVEITNAGTFDGNEPRIGGLFDPRMGTLENGKTCRSCGQTNHNCPGHFGHYKLARPVYYIQFFPMVLNVLECICIRCSKLLMDKNNLRVSNKKRGEVRWKQVLTICKNITRCGQDTEDGCGARQPDRYNRESIARIVAEWGNIEGPSSVPGDKEQREKVKERQVLECEYVLRLFRRITDEDVDFMGLNRYWCRPDWMICSVLAIPPPQVRPSVIQDNNQRSEDDLTHKLFEIINTNNTLQDKINNNAAKNIIDDQYTVLQYHVATLVDNQIPGVAPSAQRSGRPLKSIQQRLGSKEGRIRYNIQGKRVEFSGRSVITPDPNISIEELGMPIKIAMNLTIPERVTQFNRNKMYKLIQNGADIYPGAKTIVQKNGRIISLKHVNTKDIVLHFGDVVNRHLMDGDTVLFNRQPTLHRMSMMGHKVKVLPYNTFRLNVSVTSPYNADFDGDEMNCHVPQSYEASIELAEIAAVPMQIITPRHATPVIGIVQDTLIGSYRLTQPNVNFNRREFMNMMMWNKHFDGRMPEPVNGRYTGHQILSKILPSVNMEMGNKRFNEDKENPNNFVKIREGLVLQGIFDKDIFSKEGKGIIHTIFKDYGPKETVHFLDCMQSTIEQFLVYNGFSVGISDLIADVDTKNKMEEKIRARKAEVENIMMQIHLDLFTNNTGKSNKDEFENRVFSALNKATEESGNDGLGSLASENRLVSMVRAGSKGSNLNIAQMLACVGQQAPEGRRIPLGFTDRTLPHFKKYDDGAEARGFVESSFIKGLSPQEFFFHAMSGREGLIDTAVKTADTGYIQRQLVKAMEDLVTQNDGSVRDAKMNIVQFHYGEDGINATMIESQTYGIAALSKDQIIKDYGLVEQDLSQIMNEDIIREDDKEILETFVEQVLEDQDIMVKNVIRYKDVTNKRVYSPVNIERLMQTIRVKFNLSESKRTDLTPSYVINGINKVIMKTQGYHRIWSALLRFYLAPHKLIGKDRFTKDAFDTLCELLIVKNYKSRAQPGEQVGIIAAQSIGEPSTQMSCVYDTNIVINGKEKFYGKIGKFIDDMLEKNKEKLITIRENSVVLDLDDDYTIVGVSNDEKTSWKRISQVSRHPANGGLVEITTKSGRKTTATLSHSFLTRSTNGIIPILGSDLKVGTRVPIGRQIPEVPNPLLNLDGFELTKEFGWLCGIYLADGSLNGNTVQICKIHPRVEEKIKEVAKHYEWVTTIRDYQGQYGPSKNTNIHNKSLKDFLLKHFSTGSYDKKIHANVFHSNIAFIRGVVGGYFDGDGNMSVERQQIRVGSRSKDLIHDVARLLAYCGIFGSFGEETSIRIPDKVFYTYQVLKKYAAHFRDTIGLELGEKKGALDEIVNYMERDGKHDTKEIYDKIPELGQTIADLGKLLTMPGQSRNFGRWAKKESIGRLTLQGYIEDFEEVLPTRTLIPSNRILIKEKIELLRSAAYSDIVWDEIVELNYINDSPSYVYDFTVPGNQSFMVDDCIMVHNTLNTFHLAGVASKSNVTRGVPRLKELLKVTQNPKAISLTIPLKREYRDSIDKARQVAQDLELTLLKDIVTKAAIYFDPKIDESVLEEDRKLIEFYKMFETQQDSGDVEPWSKWLLRFEFDRDIMFNKNISLDTVAFALQQKFTGELNMIYSDYNSDKLIMRIRLTPEAKTSTKDDILNLKKLQTRLLTTIVIRGIPGIKSVSYRKDTNYCELVNNKYEPITQYILDTDGSNFVEIMNHPYVNGNAVLSSHVHDIYENLGVEAARATLLSEITTLFMEAGGVDYRHLGLLCDVMTRIGKLMSVDRYGINKNDIGPLAKASFEETEKILLKAALFGEIDPVTGVSANIMTGQPIRGGTSFSEILFDEQAFMRLQEGAAPIPEGDEEEYEPTGEDIENELFESQEDKCAVTNLKLNVTLGTQMTSIVEEPDIEVTYVDE